MKTSEHAIFPGMSSKFESDLKWGPIFALESNFKFGFCDEEKSFVKQYLKPKSTVLVIGSGNGREARPISRDGHDIHCIDTSLLYLLAGKSQFKKENITNVNFIQADMHYLPYRKDSFDLIFFSLYSSAGNRRLDVLKQIGEILKKDGSVILMTCTSDYVLGNNLVKQYPDFYYCRNKDELLKETDSCGLSMIETSLIKGFPYYRIALLKPEAQK